MNSTSKNLVSIAIVLAISVAAVHLYGRYDQHMSSLSAASLDWPVVEGLVTHSNLEVKRQSSGPSRKMRYLVDIDYEYVVDGQVFRNDTVRFDQGNLSNRDKERLVSDYPVGRQVQVFYNPDKPSQSVIVKGSYQ